jgi:hypothetical protein
MEAQFSKGSVRDCVASGGAAFCRIFPILLKHNTPGAVWDGFQPTKNNNMGTNIKSGLTTDDVAVAFMEAKRTEIATDLIAVRDKRPILGQAPTAAPWTPQNGLCWKSDPKDSKPPSATSKNSSPSSAAPNSSPTIPACVIWADITNTSATTSTPSPAPKSSTTKSPSSTKNKATESPKPHPPEETHNSKTEIWVSEIEICYLKNRDPCLKNHDSCLKNHDSCLKNHDSCLKNHDSGLRNHDSGLRN